MIPTQSNDLTNLEVMIQESPTYKINFDQKRIGGMIDDEDSVLQAVMKILYTERYAYPIYSSQYGVELNRFIGKDYDFIISDLSRTIEEALQVDDRILGIEELNVTKLDLNSMEVSFNVITSNERISINMEVMK